MKLLMLINTWRAWLCCDGEACLAELRTPYGVDAFCSDFRSAQRVTQLGPIALAHGTSRYFRRPAGIEQLRIETATGEQWCICIHPDVPYALRFSGPPIPSSYLGCQALHPIPLARRSIL